MNSKNNINTNNNNYKNLIKTLGAKRINANEVQFSLFAPDVSNVNLCISTDNGDLSEKVPLYSSNDNVFMGILNSSSSRIKYKFEINNSFLIPDPFSTQQDKDVHDFTVLYEFPFDSDDKVVKTNYNFNDLIIYELHIGTFTDEGTFLSAIEKLDYLVNLGITAIELMPVADFAGKFGWGYDGVLMFAPDSNYGSPEDLKLLIKTAHQKGLDVILDVVYNHFGPEGNYIYPIAGSVFFNTKKDTPWGAAINFNHPFVREFFIANALYWLKEFNFDGLRFDAVHAIYDDSNYHILDEISDRIKQEITDRNIHLILENGNNNSSFLREKYNAQWNDDAHHCYHTYLTGENHGYYSDFTPKATGCTNIENIAKVLTQGFLYQGQKSAFDHSKPRGEYSKDLTPEHFINFVQNHDQIGNRALGERISQIANIDKLKNITALNLLAPSIPLIFMGEEWGSMTPFLFFSDLCDELKPFIKKGRQKEFSYFPEFRNKNLLEKIPDPTSIKTFRQSKLNWSELENEFHKSYFEYTKNLIKIRKKFIQPLIKDIIQSKTYYKIISNEVIDLNWPTQNLKIRILANLGANSIPIDIDKSKIIYTNNNENKNQPTILPNSLILILNY